MVHRIIILLLISTLHQKVQAQQKVKTHEGVEIGGIKQWIGAVGKDRSQPILLFIHGGPGFSSRVYSKKFIKHLQDDFIIAQWDQRETGITAHWSPYKDSLTLVLFYNDLSEVVNYLLKRFEKEKLYLVGFSWGGHLGFQFASKHSELLHAYIPVSSMIYNDESERRTLAYLKQEAKKQQNDNANSELQSIQIPFKNWEQLYGQRRWTYALANESGTKRAYPKSLFADWSDKWFNLFLSASAIDFRQEIESIECPTHFFVSKKDYVANWRLTEEFYNQLNAPKKSITWFYESDHEIPSEEPKKFSDELIKIKNKLN